MQPRRHAARNGNRKCCYLPGERGIGHRIPEMGANATNRYFRERESVCLCVCTVLCLICNAAGIQGNAIGMGFGVLKACGWGGQSSLKSVGQEVRTFVAMCCPMHNNLHAIKCEINAKR